MPIESSYLEYQARREHLRRAQQQIQHGFYPVDLSVASIDQDPTPQFCSTWWRGTIPAAERAERGKRIARLAVTLWRLDDRQAAQSCLEESEHVAVRGAMIAAFADHDLDPTWLIDRLVDGDASDTLRRSCAMALSLYSKQAIAPHVVGELQTQLASLYASQPDPGLRSTIESIATKLDMKLDAIEVVDPASEFLSVQGDRMVVISPQNPVWIGSPNGQPGRDPAKEPLVPVNLSAKFAIATREVTVEQFLKFRPDHGYAKDYARTTDCPIIDVSWFDAASYCRWLSEQEGIPESEMCYPKLDAIQPGMQLREGYQNRIGYRLPTEAEWELACRGGVASSRWFGFDPELLADHAWTTQNSEYRLRPVAKLLPNDFGLFDMLGNAKEWCHASLAPYPTFVSRPIEDPGHAVLRIEQNTLMIDRGGANLYQPLDARSSQRESHGARARRVYISFRVARTIESIAAP